MTHDYQVIDYDLISCFRRFGDALSTAWRERDVYPHKAIIVDTMTLLGNSGYGKTITNVDRQRGVNYCTGKAASLMINDRRFRQPDVVVDDVYELEMNKKTVTYALPIHVGFFVLQYTKMRMLQLYYDFINRYLERPLFQYCEMDTDSAYLALVVESVDDLVAPDLREHYFRHLSEWLPSVATNIRTSTCDFDSPIARGSVTRHVVKRVERSIRGHRVCSKVEWSDDGFVGLCSKTYYCFGATNKYSTKWLSKRYNAFDKDAFLEVLSNSRSGSGKNREFRVRHSSVLTYAQERAVLTYFYANGVVHEDGWTTGPVDV